jgi:hypothetical protein
MHGCVIVVATDRELDMASSMADSEQLGIVGEAEALHGGVHQGAKGSAGGDQTLRRRPCSAEEGVGEPLSVLWLDGWVCGVALKLDS